jgi:hypothetical protein
MASRVALLGNIAFLGCVLLRYTTFVQDPALTSLLLILGWFIGIWLNLGVNIWVIIQWRRKRLSDSGVPAWLLWVNAAFCVFELYYFLFI